MNTPKNESSRSKDNKNLIGKLPEFEPGLPWYFAHNIEAAGARGLVYDNRKEVYVDNEGCPALDRFGQPLG